MEMLKKISHWAKELAEVGLSLVGLGIILEVLFKGANIPFWPDISVVANIMAILGGLSNEGLLGLVGAFIIYHMFKHEHK